MIGRPSLSNLCPAVVTAAACLFAAWVIVDTVRAVVPLWSPLPWFDAWATVESLHTWQAGQASLAEVLFSQSNEHRILVPRLVFFADDLFCRGGGYLSLACIGVVQALHAGLFGAALHVVHPGRWGGRALAAVVTALMFSLRQGENFSSGFQLQFVGVFAGATLSFLLFGLAVGRERRGEPVAPPLLASFGAVLVTTFTMANGLATGFILVVLALAGRMRPWIVLACLAWAVLLAAAYLYGYKPVEHHSRPSESLRHPVDLLLYTATYLGSILTTDSVPVAATFGVLGMATAGAAALRTLSRGGAGLGVLTMVGVMLFVAAAALATASGRLEFGTAQAMASRYATGSATFWAAQLTYWWIDPPTWLARLRRLPLARGAVALVALMLCGAVAGAQSCAKLLLAWQSFAQNESANLLMLGLDDPATILRTAWSDEDVQRLVPVMRADHISIFGTPQAEGVGRPVTEQGAVLSPDPCNGEIGTARAEPALGQDGVRLSGSAWNGPAHRLLRRIVLADAEGRLVGFGSGAIPGAGRSDWSGFAVAPVGAMLVAYARVDGSRLCRVGAAAVVDGSAPAATPAP